MKEIWKDIPGYEGLYQISNYGKIKTVERLMLDKWNRKYIRKTVQLKPSKDTSGYSQIVLTKDNKRKSFKVHRLVATAFLPNPYSLPQINHKDENKLNNYIDNLEWCTFIYNINYGTRNIRCTKHRFHQVNQFDLEKNFIQKFNSLKEAQKKTGIKYQQISSACRKRQKSAGGYIWEYC